MPRLINLADHKNLWGIAATDGGLEPQRSDLWLVDLTNVVNGLNSNQGLFTRLELPNVPALAPQFVQSITLPELKMKPEVVRRDSVPFNMPSWDEPMDAVKITFLVETNSDPKQSLVISLLTAWQAIVRAGRGDRTDLYTEDTFSIPLNANYRYDYTFPIRVAQLRGGSTGLAPLTDQQIAELNQSMANQSQQSVLQNQATSGAASPPVPAATQLVSSPGSLILRRVQTVTRRPLTQQPWLQVTSNWTLSNAWLASWKMSDLSYTESKLVTVDALIYVEDLFQTNA